MHSVESFLQHFSAQPYDPVKAHEYYIKNRQLQGRKTSGMSQEQKEAWVYSKGQITTDKKKQLESSKISNAKKIDDFQAAAEATRERISEKLKLLNEKLTKEAARDREDIAYKLMVDIDNVPPIPKGVSGKLRDILIDRRNKKIEDIRKASSKYASNINSDNKETRQEGSEDASSEREKTRTELKTILATTRESYTKEKAKLISDYETTYQKEYDKVLATVKGKPKPKTKPKGLSKGKPNAEPKQKKRGIIYYNGKGPTR